MRIHTVDASSAQKVNSHQLKFQSFNPAHWSPPPVTAPRKHSPPPPATSYLGWHERLRGRVPDPKARDVVVTMARFMDEAGQVGLHVATLAEACGVSRSTFQRRARELARLGVLTIVTRRVARDYNASNTYIINIHAVFRGGPCQSCHGKALKANTKAESIRPPAEAQGSPPPNPVPAKPPTRHIIASSRIASQLCSAHGIGHWQRRWLTERIEERLKAGEHGDAIEADLDREYRSRSSGKPHRGTWRSRREAEEERMARDLYTQTRQLTPEEFAELEAREREAQAHEAAGEVWVHWKNCWEVRDAAQSVVG